MGFEDLDEGDQEEQPRQDGGFDDLEAAMGGGGGDGGDDRDDQEDSDVQEDSADPATTPAFAYDDTKNAAQYVREATARAYDEAWEYDAKAYLGRDLGIENVEKREWQDAALRFAAAHPEEVAELIVEAREDAHGSIGENSP
ncbi:hypothetical protein DVK02_14895 [Halobellus sp. Atlit-31R]|nr:hypothetical protein DVK02_14895 [Halobellus sp. Atlit-31R]